MAIYEPVKHANFSKLKFNNFFLWTWCSIKIFTTYVVITGDSDETYRIVIAYTEKEIYNIKQTGVFCVDKRPVFSGSVTYIYG